MRAVSLRRGPCGADGSALEDAQHAAGALLYGPGLLNAAAPLDLPRVVLTLARAHGSRTFPVADELANLLVGAGLVDDAGPADDDEYHVDRVATALGGLHAGPDVTGEITAIRRRRSGDHRIARTRRHSGGSSGLDEIDAALRDAIDALGGET